MATVTVMSVVVLAMKAGISVVSVVGVASGINWFNKKTFSTKKGGGVHEGDFDDEKFSRHHLH